MATRLFVYGTLKRGFCRASFLDAERLVGVDRTVPDYRLFDCGSYPALVRAETARAGRSIHGEIWEISEHCLRILDKVEGSPRLYCREPVRLVSGVEAEAYFYRRATNRLKECGDCWT